MDPTFSLLAAPLLLFIAALCLTFVENAIKMLRVVSTKYKLEPMTGMKFKTPAPVKRFAKFLLGRLEHVGLKIEEGGKMEWNINHVFCMAILLVLTAILFTLLSSASASALALDEEKEEKKEKVSSKKAKKE